MKNTSSHGHTRQRRSKTALVLAGGGILGAVYEIGALRAVNDLLVSHTVNDFDIYIGTSAGALVTSMLANGMTPNEMMQAINDSHPEVRAIQTRDLFRGNLVEAIWRLTRLPQVALRSGRDFVRTRAGERIAGRLIWDFADLLPSGFYSGAALEGYVAEIFDSPGLINRFDSLDKALYIIATDLDTGQRTVFGKGGKGVVPISKAVAASSAIPVLYKPVRIFGREYVDGSLRGNASVDLAVEAGADLVVCINPLVPLDAETLYGPDEHVGDEGVRTILNQVLRIIMHAGVHYHIKTLRRQYPHVDFILIEPRPDDQKMFNYNLMNYSSRLRAAEHGFESVTERLMEQTDYIRATLGRHDIVIDSDRLVDEMEAVRASNYDPTILFGDIYHPESDSASQNGLPIVQRMRSLEERLGLLNGLLDNISA